MQETRETSYKCETPCKPRSMIGQSWWKELGYNSHCICAWDAGKKKCWTDENMINYKYRWNFIMNDKYEEGGGEMDEKNKKNKKEKNGEFKRKRHSDVDIQRKNIKKEEISVEKEEISVEKEER